MAKGNPFHPAYNYARFREHSALFPRRTEFTFERLLWTWEKLRELDTEGYRTSEAKPRGSTWLVQTNWADGRSTGPSRGRGTSCSPFTTQSIAMAMSQETEGPFHPKLGNGDALPLAFSLAANGNLDKRWGSSRKAVKRFKMRKRDLARGGDDGWPRSAVFFNLAYVVEPTEMRRGDLVKIEWMPRLVNGKKRYGGHAVFCWDVHLDKDGKVDAFQYISSNGGMSNGGSGAGVSVGGMFYYRKNKFLKRTKKGPPPAWEVLKKPFFEDDDDYVRLGHWVTWRKDTKAIDLSSCRVKPRQKHPQRANHIAAARLWGVQPPEPYAMGNEATKPPPMEIQDLKPKVVRRREVEKKEPEKARNEHATEPRHQDEKTATGGQRMVEERLKALYDLALIDKDPGEPDDVNDPQTQEAIKDFQGRHGLTADGIAGRKTKPKLKEVYEQALRTPAGQRYVIEGVGARKEDEEPGEGGGGEGDDGEDRKASDAMLYWRHGSAEPLESVQVIAIAPSHDGGTFSLKLRNEASGETIDTGANLAVQNGRGTAKIEIPAIEVTEDPVRFVALAEGLGETEAPLFVH